MTKKTETKKPNRLTISQMAVVAFLSLFAGQSAFGQWAQWGGPQRNFNVDTKDLADKWPDDGPKKLWTRALGTGYSGLTIADGKLFTMYRTSRSDPFEYAVALDVKTGETIWKHKNLAAVPSNVADYGKKYSGPNATPLVVGDRVFMVGRNARLLCLNTADGKVLWTKKLNKKFGAQTHVCGFSSSPIAYGDTVIVPIGHNGKKKLKGNSLLAFDQKSGDVVWSKDSFESWHSSPILIDYAGERQLVQCTNTALIGVSPADGSARWKYEYPNVDQYEGIWATPVWDGKDTIFFSSRKVGCAVQLSQSDSKTVAKELWSSAKTPFGMGTPILVDGLLIGAKRGQNAAFMGLDASTGKRKWFKRLYPGATVLGDKDKLIVLDSDGLLALVLPGQKKLTIASSHQLTEQYSFTAPSLVGTTLFVRDEKNVMALDLGVASEE